MYVSIQKIYGKSKIYGYSKDVVTTITKLGTTTQYGWKYSEEKFERENYSYKIVVKESYRENGRVKQRQVVMGTFRWFDFIDHPIDRDKCFEKKLLGMFSDKPDKAESIYDEIDKKIEYIQSVEAKKWHSSKEYKIHNKHLDMIRKYEAKKIAFDDLYGENVFEQIYDIHLNIMNQDMYEQLPDFRAAKKKADEEKREQEQREYEKQQKEWDEFFKRYASGSYSSSSHSNYTDKEKEYLKKFYRVLAIKYHPDMVKEDDDGAMKFLNKLKEQWRI